MDPRAWKRTSSPGARTAPRRARALAQTAAALRRGRAPADAVVAAFSMLAAYQLSPVYGGNLWSRETFSAAGVHAVSFMLVAYAAGLHAPGLGTPRPARVFRSLAAAGLAGAITLAFFYAVFYRPIGRWVISGATVLTATIAFLLDEGLRGLLRHRPRRVLFVGKSVLAERVTLALAAESGPLYEIVGTWPEPGPEATPPDSATADDLVGVCRTREVDELVLAASAVDLEGLLLPALRCLPLGCHVRTEADFHEDVFEAVPLIGVTPEWMLSRGWDTSNRLAEVVKRVSDIALALLILIGLAPLTLLAMLLVKATTGGPVMYSQIRVGRYGRPFRILKLRTMTVDAEDAGPQWSPRDDPRRTPIGRVLRRTRIDEVPQVLNVLRGDMSFVGPRPERPEFVERFEQSIPYYAWRHVVRPGLTGWAQVQYPYGFTVDDARKKLEYDLYYIRHASLSTDLAIVLRTAAIVLRTAAVTLRGAR
jgi:exopolysaccharide biosynthesis polyprenyl glycosylphosphotransferase